MIPNQLNMKKDRVFGRLSTKILACLKSNRTKCAEYLTVSGCTETSLFTWYCSVWLFSFPQIQEDYQRGLFWRHGGHQKGCNNRAERHPSRILAAVNKSIVKWILPKELAFGNTIYICKFFKKIDSDGSFYVPEEISAWPSLLTAAPGTFSIHKSQEYFFFNFYLEW